MPGRTLHVESLGPECLRHLGTASFGEYLQRLQQMCFTGHETFFRGRRDQSGRGEPIRAACMSSAGALSPQRSPVPGFGFCNLSALPRRAGLSSRRITLPAASNSRIFPVRASDRSPPRRPPAVRPGPGFRYRGRRPPAARLRRTAPPGPLPTRPAGPLDAAHADRPHRSGPIARSRHRRPISHCATSDGSMREGTAAFYVFGDSRPGPTGPGRVPAGTGRRPGGRTGSVRTIRPISRRVMRRGAATQPVAQGRAGNPARSGDAASTTARSR